jgi:transcriptional pleiotropic regulator of transition state genes
VEESKMNLITERKIDELGRIVLPAEVRNRLGIKENCTVSINEDGDRIVLCKTVPCCKLCGSTEAVQTEISLCDHCIAKIKEL